MLGGVLRVVLYGETEVEDARHIDVLLGCDSSTGVPARHLGGK